MLRTYQILELGLTLESVDPAFLEDIHADYLRFETRAPLNGRALSILFQPPGAGAPFLEVDGVRRPLDEHPDPGQYARFAVHRLLMEAMEGFTVLHAAVLDTGTGALAICGSPGTGKTTLTLDLLEAGLGFMSDDFCPVNRATALVHPYPRSLWVREPRVAATASGRELHRGKRQLSPARVVTEPRTLEGFVFLDPGPQEPGPVLMEVRIRPAGREAFLREAGSVEGVQAFHPPEGREHEVRVLYPRQGPAIRALMAVMDRHRDDIWNFFGVPTSNPDFTREPVLEPIPSHEAAFLLLKERKQRTVSLDGSPLEPGAFLAHLNGLLAGVPCHRLTAGPRDKRLSLVLQCLGKG